MCFQFWCLVGSAAVALPLRWFKTKSAGGDCTDWVRAEYAFLRDGNLAIRLALRICPSTADGTSFTGLSTGTGSNYSYNYFGPGRIVAQ